MMRKKILFNTFFCVSLSLFTLNKAFSNELLATDKDESLAAEEIQNQNDVSKRGGLQKEVDPHLSVYEHSLYPSAKQCKTCHEEIYKEWSVSSHAYASISPMFNKFEQRINDLTQGSIENFCVRCHASVGTTIGDDRDIAIWDRSQAAREGITCITCHRISEEFGKVNGARRIVPGSIHKPVTAAGNGKELQKVLDKKGHYKVATKEGERGMKIHTGAIKFDTLSKSEFCMGCHQVAVHPGIKLEVVWDQYRASPAFKDGVTCIQCHMGKEPGNYKAGYETGSRAILNGKEINPKRKKHNHMFYGPGYPIAHPGIFPFNEDAEKFTIKNWLKFDYRSNWGKKDFESLVEVGKIKTKFPKEWEDSEDRIDARRVVEENIKRIKWRLDHRKKLMDTASKIDGPFFKSDLKVNEDLEFKYIVTNITPGHNLPSGSLGAQPQIWLNVALTDPDGNNIWESGYMDNNGDVADIHSLDVQAGKVKFDDQLFNLQTKFLTTNVKGTDREMYLPVNFDFDQLPLIRQANAPNTILNHPAFVRMEARSIPPLGSKDAKYEVPGKLLKKPGKYKLSVRLRSRAEPIYFMKFVFSTKDMIRSMNEWIGDVHPYTVEFEIKK